MSKRRTRILVPISLVVLFFVVFFGSMAFWQIGWKHSVADTSSGTTTVVQNKSTQSILTIDTTFYNYRYDKEIYNNVRDQGSQSCYDEGTTPFHTFDSKLSAYYISNKVTSGIYSGNFYHYYGSLPGSAGLKWHNYSWFNWAPNIANRGDGSSVCQGIVYDELIGFTSGNITSGKLMMGTNSNVEVPYFNESFLTTTKENSVAIGAVREHVGFPFREITSGTKKGYYEFNSTTDVVRFQNMWNQSQDGPSDDRYYFGTDGNLEYYYNNNKVYCKAATDAQFFPFNKENAGQDQLDYGFGVRFNIPFRLSDDGKVDGKPMVFEFSGDDDVWVFLDGKLVLDLGGQHGKATGTINFSGSNDKATSTVAKVTRVNGSSSAKETALSNSILSEDTWIEKDVSKTITGIKKGADNLHVLTVFYMERGMFESNFHMAFNFVPANKPVPSPTPTPTPVATPDVVEKATGQLKIENKVIFPTTTADNGSNETDKINPAFLQEVKDQAEEDVFSYSVKNQGTWNENVGDSEIKYPSGKLTVRQNPNTTKKEKSYLSFGAQSKMRVYFDIGTIESYISKLSNDTSNSKWYNTFKFDYSGDKQQIYNTIKVDNGWLVLNKLQNKDGIYYVDIDYTAKTIKIETYWISGLIFLGDSMSLSDGFDGKLFIPTAQFSTSNGEIKVTSYKWEDANDSHPALGGGGDGKTYSNTLPFETVGSSRNFKPDDSRISGFQAVGNTSFTLMEAFLAPKDSNILYNSEETSGITNANGQFGLFYNDSATFKNQFFKGSRMQVVQNSGLLQPKRYTGSLSTSTSAETARTKFVDSSSNRKVEDYYYTTIEALSSNGNKTAPIDVTYDGQYNFVNGSGIEDSTVNITQTFTNTVKTGSLTISKKLEGNADDDSKYSYTYNVSFSKIFGSDSTTTLYSGKYLLIDAEGKETSKTADNGKIVLHPNETAKILGIPVGTSYKIQEIVTDNTIIGEISTVYKAFLDDEVITSPTYKATNVEDAGITIDNENRTIEGVIPCGIINKSYNEETKEYQEVDVNISYTNLFGSITITKRVDGDINPDEYYGKTEKKYCFSVTQGTQPYTGAYKVYTYTYPNGYNNPAVKVATSYVATDGFIWLEQGQEAEICERDLTDSTPYTIKEIVDTTDIFKVDSIKVTEGNVVTEPDLHDATVKATLDTQNPTFHVVYNNYYHDSFIEIDKYVDALYYGDRKYTDSISYQDLTKAKQSFLFKVKQYKTKVEAEAGKDDYERCFDIVLSIGNDTEKLKPSSTKTLDGTTFNYKISRKIQVIGNRYYRIEEDTSLSWKYILKGASVNLSGLNDSTDGFGTADNNTKVVILKSCLNKAALPIAEFYNVLNSDKKDVDGDVDDAVNKIYKDRQDMPNEQES